MGSYVEGHVQKNPSLIFMSSVDFQVSKICGGFFGKIFVEQFWKSFTGRNSSLEPRSFFFKTSNSLPYNLEESRELRDLTRWDLGYFAFFSCYYEFTNYFEILIVAFSNTIPTGVSICKILLS